MSNFIPLVVVQDGPSEILASVELANTKPAAKLIPAEVIEDIHVTPFGSSLKLGGGSPKEVLVLESPLQVKTAEKPGDTDLNIAKDVDAAVDAAGTAQSNGYNVTKYFTNVNNATASSAEALDLPAATVGTPLVITNATDVPLSVFPASGETIDDLAANAARTIPGGGTLYLGCVVAGQWISSTL